MNNISKLKPLDKIVIIRNCTGLSVTQKSILYSIASRLGKENFCFPSITTLMKDSGLSKRNAVVDNINSMVKADIVIKIPPSNGYKSNRYGINFNLLVTNGYQCSNPKLPDWVPRVTSLVTYGYPKRNIKGNLKEIKEDLFFQKPKLAIKTIKEIKQKLGNGHIKR